MVNRIKYARTLGQRNRVADDMANLNIEEAPQDAIDLTFFKSCVYDRNDKNQCEVIKQKSKNLQRTIEAHKNALKDKQMDIRVNFPYLLLNHDLVNRVRIFKIIQKILCI